MPEQTSAKSLPVTASEIASPFDTAIWPYGLGGLNLKDQIDAIPVGQFSRLTNITHTMDRGVTARPGLTTLATAGTTHHSVRRLHDPESGVDTRVWGIDQSLYIGLSGALSAIDTGYSGAPLYLLPHRPPLSGDPWMFVADRSRMRKVRADGLDLEIGLAAPGSAPTLGLAALRSKDIALFAASDGTASGSWTGNAGSDFSTPPIPTDAPSTVPDGEFVLNPGAAVGAADPLTGCYSFWGLTKTLDLSTFGAGVDTEDEDLMTLSLQFSHPNLAAEVRLYLVCSPNFDPTVIPGTSINGQSTDFYVKVFRPDDFALAVAAAGTTQEATEAARIQALRDQSLVDQASADGFSADVIRSDSSFLERYDPRRGTPFLGSGGGYGFKDFGVVGVPLRRGDFRRYGTTANCDWSTITGLCIYYQVLPGGSAGPTSVAFVNWTLMGGYGPDTSEPGAQSYDYRYTHYDPRTGAESNPSPEMSDANFIDALRRGITVAPAAYGDAAVRQRIYRRGGSLISDWYFAGTNASDGGVFTDSETDDGIAAAGTVNLDHYQPVPTVNDAGATVLAQPVPVLFGPANGLLFGLGDLHRPGHLYWCIPDEPDHWPAENNYEVCPPSEELMAGGMYGAQPFCFSRERLYLIYPNLSDTTSISVTTSACRRGLVSRWAWAIGLGGIYGVSKDAIFRTGGGEEEVISIDIQPLFRGQTWNGYAPIDFSQFTDCRGIRLAVYQDELYFLYPGTDACHHVLVYSILFKFWRAYQHAQTLAALTADDDTPIQNLLVGDSSLGKTYLHDLSAYSDDGQPIVCTVRTGAWDLGKPRIDKLLGDQIVDADPQGAALVLQNRLNNETLTNAAQAFAVVTGRSRFVFDSFGTTPQRARNISTDISWSSTTARPTLYFLGQSVIAEPDVTIARMTQWDDLGHADEKYLTGLTIECDTYGVLKTFVVEGDHNGVIVTLATKTVTASGRRKFAFSWAAQTVHNVRIRPTDSIAWVLYSAAWIQTPEPPDIAGWDTYFEAEGDRYYTGLDLFCDTHGTEKQLQVTVDGAILTNPYTSEAFWRVTATGRTWVHLTFLAGRGHVFHVSALDTNPGRLYSHKWITEAEPGEQSNWNQGFSVYGSRADKYLKAIIFECDTFGVAKSVNVEADGVVVETLSISATGRSVVQRALTTQQLGRVWRMYPVDGNPGRLYSAQPIFDEEPFQLSRWETQETDHDQNGFFVPIDAQITLKSPLATPVTLTVDVYINQTGTIVSDSYVIPSTGGVKDKRYVSFQPRKGVLVKYTLTADAAFWLYQEESSVRVLPWGSDQALLAHPFGNSGSDRTRLMTNSVAAAARSGGGT